MTRTAPITHVATTDIADMLEPVPTGRRMPMRGFDEEFVDIADYIVRITERIWHERKVDLCRRYYAPDGIIHTLSGDIVGAATVEANTRATLEAFPDRTLDADNVIWSGDENTGFYSSHLITSRMTNRGASEFGPATGRRARIRTIADCLCRENQVVEEWLVRDNAALVTQLGFDPDAVAREQADADREAGRSPVDLAAPFRDAALAAPAIAAPETKPTPESQPEEFARALFEGVWNKRGLDLLPDYFDYRVGAHLTAGRDLYGVVEMREYLGDFFAALPDLRISVDHVASIPYLGEARDIAVRWSLAATHAGDGLFGPASGAPVALLGATHWRVMRGRVREEWTVFDELALRRQIEAWKLD